MFEDCKIYKQWHKKAGRYYALIYNLTTKSHKSMSWAKYTMCLHLGRVLDPKTETVDHINNDKTDDRLENLQILTIGDNIRKSAKGVSYVTLVCPHCKKEFEKEKRLTHLTKGRGKRTFCSRNCLYLSQRLSKF